MSFFFLSFFSFPKTAINGEKNCLTHKLQESCRESLDVLIANAATPCKKAQAAALCDSFIRQPGDAAECRKCLSLCSLEINKKGIDKSAGGNLWSSSGTDPPSPKTGFSRAEQENKDGFMLPFCFHCPWLADEPLHPEAKESMACPMCLLPRGCTQGGHAAALCHVPPRTFKEARREIMT